MSDHAYALKLGMINEKVAERIREIQDEIDELKSKGKDTKTLELKKNALVRRYSGKSITL